MSACPRTGFMCRTAPSFRCRQFPLRRRSTERRGGRVVYRVGLENRSRATDRGFESHPLRQTDESSPRARSVPKVQAARIAHGGGGMRPLAAGPGFERRSELREQIQRSRSANRHSRRQSHLRAVRSGASCRPPPHLRPSPPFHHPPPCADGCASFSWQPLPCAPIRSPRSRCRSRSPATPSTR